MNDRMEFVDVEGPRLMRINGDFIDRVNAREALEREELPRCVGCGCAFSPSREGQRYCSRGCANRTRAREGRR